MVRPTTTRHTLRADDFGLAGPGLAGLDDFAVGLDGFGDGLGNGFADGLEGFRLGLGGVGLGVLPITTNYKHNMIIANREMHNSYTSSERDLGRSADV